MVDTDKGGLGDRNRPRGGGPEGVQGQEPQCRFLQGPPVGMPNPLPLAEGAQVEVQRLQRSKGLRRRHESVSAYVSHQVLHRAFLVGLSGRAEGAVEEIVSPQAAEVLVLDSLWAGEDLANGRLGVVIPNLRKDAAEELKTPHVTIQEGFQLLGGISHGKRHLGVLGPQAEDEDLLHGPGDHHVSLTEVGLSHLAGHRFQGHEDLGAPAPKGTHRPAHGHLRSGEVVFRDQTVIDALGGVALLARGGLIIGEPAFDHGEIGSHDRTRTGNPLLITKRLGRGGQHLSHRLPRHFKLAGDLADRPAFVFVLLLDELHVDHLQHMPSPCPSFALGR